MAQRHYLIGREALMRSIGNFSFERVDDAGHLTGYGLVSLGARAIIGGVVLSAANAFVAGLFGVPEFGEMRSMGFVMASVLGLCLAAWFLVYSLRNTAEMD
jgi:hypothetical protein